MVEYLERDLGVQVQRVSVHKMKYSFQIWLAMMSSMDSDGQVGEVAQAKAGVLREGRRISPLGPTVESYRAPRPAQKFSVLLCSLNRNGNRGPRGALLLQ